MGDPVRSFLAGVSRPAGIGKTVSSAGPGTGNYYPSPWYRPGTVGSLIPSRMSTTTAGESLHSMDPLASIRANLHSFPLQNSVVDTLGLNTNWFIPYARKVGKFGQGTYEDFVTGQMIWVNKDKNKPLFRRTHHTGMNADWPGGRPPLGIRTANSMMGDASYAKRQPLGARYSMFTLQRLNWTFALTELKPTDDEEKMMDAETRMSTWYLEGAVRNEEGGENRLGLTQDRTNEKVLNNNVSGHAYVHNLWGNEIQPQTNLWFIAKRCPRSKLPEHYVLNGKGHALRTSVTKLQLEEIFRPVEYDDPPEGGFAGRDDEMDSTDLLTDYPFQVIPWASSSYSRPPPDVLEYQDDFGETSYGKAIYVGKVEITPRYSHGQRFGKVWHDTVAAIATPKMWIFVDGKPDS